MAATFEQMQQFIELRAENVSYEKVAAQLKVSKTTLINWSKDCELEIQNRRAIVQEALISVDDFLKVNKVRDLADPKLVSSIMVKPRDSTKADMLRSIIICGYCEKPFASGITTKRDKVTKKIYEARYYYRCETDGCVYKNKSLRAKVVVDYAANFLDEHLFTTEAN